MSISKMQARTHRKKPWNSQKPKPARPKKKLGVMLFAYCTSNQCDDMKIYGIQKAGSLCPTCGFPMSCPPRKVRERNKYADGPINSGSADKWTRS